LKDVSFEFYWLILNTNLPVLSIANDAQSYKVQILVYDVEASKLFPHMEFEIATFLESDWRYVLDPTLEGKSSSDRLITKMHSGRV